MHVTTRRLFLASTATTAVTALAGCMGSSRDLPLVGSMFGGSAPGAGRGRQPNYAEIYASFPGEQHPLPAFDYSSVDPLFLRQEVDFATRETPGSIVVDPSKRFLYLVERGGGATRYGVGVGREGFAWAGKAHINLRRAWPDWIPPREMIERNPEIRLQIVHTSRGEGVPGGPTKEVAPIIGRQGASSWCVRIPSCVPTRSTIARAKPFTARGASSVVMWTGRPGASASL